MREAIDNRKETEKKAIRTIRQINIPIDTQSNE
jgi:hypothetical protein